MSRGIRGGILAASLAAFCAPAFAISNNTTISPLTRGVAPPAATTQRADGLYDVSGRAIMLGTPGYTARAGTPEAMGREFIAARSAELGLSPEDAASLVKTTERTGRQLSVVRYAQRVGGVPVYGSDIAISVLPNGRIVYVANATVPGASAPANTARLARADAIG